MPGSALAFGSVARRHPWLVAALASALLLTLTFVGRLAGDFVWDDVLLVQKNSSLTDPGGIWRILGDDLWGSAGQGHTQLYHPLPMLSLWLQAHLHGVELVPMRFANVLLHGGCALTFWALLRRLGLSLTLASVAAALFLLHPLVTEPVMWLTGRHDTLAVLFSLLALLAFPKPESPRQLARSALAGLACAAAFASKEPYVVLPALLALLSLIERRRPQWSRLALLWLAPLLGVLAIFGLRRWLGISTDSEQLRAPPFELLRAYASIAWHYGALSLTLQQGPTIATYHPLAPLEAGVVWLVLLGAFGALWRTVERRAGRVALLGLGWFALSLAPHVLSLPLLGLWGNRYGYFPLLGVCVALAAAGDALEAQASAIARGAIPVLLGAEAALGLLQTRSAAQLWRDDLTLYSASVEADPQDARALYHYAHASRQRSGCRAAVPLLARAVEIEPGYARAQRNLAGCWIDLGRPELAIAPAERAVALEPLIASHHYNLGTALAYSGDRARGLAELRRALELDPGHAGARALAAQLAAP